MKYILLPFGTVGSFAIAYLLAHLYIPHYSNYIHYSVYLIATLLLFFLTIYLTDKYYLKYKYRIILLFIVTTICFIYTYLAFLSTFLSEIITPDEYDPHGLGIDVMVIALFYPSLFIWGIIFDIVKLGVEYLKGRV